MVSGTETTAASPASTGSMLPTTVSDSTQAIAQLLLASWRLLFEVRLLRDASSSRQRGN